MVVFTLLVITATASTVRPVCSLTTWDPTAEECEAYVAQMPCNGNYGYACPSGVFPGNVLLSHGCPLACTGSDWTSISGLEYKLFKEVKNAADAEAFCQTQGGNLATFLNDLQSAVIKALAYAARADGVPMNQYNQAYFLIGYYRTTGYSRGDRTGWQWRSGVTSDYMNWATHYYPENHHGNKRCVGITTFSDPASSFNGGWRDLRCSDSYWFFCSRPAAAAVSAGDPHILRFDGTAFDIDTTGSYSLFNVAGGGQFSVKSKVAHENRLNSKLTFNTECEFGGSWLGGHNVTAVAAGVEAGMEAGIYFDGLFVSIPKLLQNTSQYTWEFTGHSKMILEICQIAGDMSDYCISTFSLRRQSSGGHAFMTMVTDIANITVRYNNIRSAGHLDIYTTLQQDADTTQIGGLLAGGRHATRRGNSPLLASSVGAVGDVGIEG